MEYRQSAAGENAAAAGDEGRGPLISVIIPVFNAGAFLRETLDSLLAQDFRDMEILCVNDGSTDDSGAILADYAARDGRFRILERENGGVSRARNVGTCAAQGKYLYYMDHDDLLEQGALTILAAEMERSGLEYLCFNATAFGRDPESGKRAENFNRGYLNRQLKEGEVYTGQALFRLLKTEPDMRYISPAWACMISRAFVLENEIRFDPDILNEDELWSVQVLMKVQRAGCLNRKLYRYRVHSDSLTRRADTFSKAYSKFLCVQAIRRIISAPDFTCEPGTESFLLAHIVRLQKKAAGYYAACSPEEQEKRRLLPLEEQSWFESLVVLPADMEDRRKKVERELRSSPEYRVGRVLTWLPRKLRALLKRISRS
jgi:glycosyltransferase involved in cell wall biosynthesis